MDGSSTRLLYLTLERDQRYLENVDKAKAHNIVYASDEKHEEMEPTHNAQSKTCTRRSVEGRKQEDLETNSSVLDERNVKALTTIGEQKQTHGEESSKKSSD